MDQLEALLTVGPLGLAVSISFWLFVYNFGKVLSVAVAPTVYAGLDSKKKDEWDNYVLAFVHAVLATIGAYAAVSDVFPGVPEDPFESSSKFQQLVLQLTLAYIIVDTALMLLKWESLGGVPILIHHLLFPLTYGIGLYYLQPAFGCYVMLIMQLCEASTPFLHLRWFLSTAGVKDGRAFVNAVFLSVTYIGVRGVMMTVMLYRVFSPRPEAALYWPGSPIRTLSIACGWVFQGLQYMWCYKVLMGFMSLLKKKKKGSTDSDKAKDS